MAQKATVILDAGHGGENHGAVFEGRKEKDDALALTLAVGTILEKSGVNVLYTRVDDQFDTPLEKARIANASGADYFLSIHRNAMPIPGSASGAEVLVYRDEGVARELANRISENLEQAGFTNLGVKERPDLVVLRRTQMPAVLVEAGFLDHPADNQFFDEHFQDIARAIAQGVLDTIWEQKVETSKYYQVQVGAYRDRTAAERELEGLKEQGLPAFLVYGDGWYKVRVGAYRELDHAVRMEQTMRQLGYPTMMVYETRV